MAIDAAMLVWVRQTIGAELGAADGMDPESDLVRQLAAGLLDADGATFKAHVRANSAAKLAILERCETTLADPEARDRARDLAADVAVWIAYGYRFRPGWMTSWAPEGVAGESDQ